MALQNKLLSLSFPAAGDLSASQFRFVSVNSAGRVAITGAGAHASGVLQGTPDAIDKTAEVAMLNGSGKVKVMSAGTIAAGAKVMSDASGEALTATATNHVLGTAAMAAVAGDIFSILPLSSHVL
jgi:hypothetical protein